ncbi:hypothetical protein PVS71_07755 [Pediococcus acidilactici]|uniref:hypothetical protein n=1 Tax=Pediococcus acidilactici TaxID=1254 RepID=UPI00237FA1AC|nr:hypothetical protein [Pediococcus acidilactici]WDV24857.1 hypothetical protein PVS71_07755 [Pediococcus acidilactici]WEE13922.1 hypothetical protein PX336_07755 [Pediococcus acidilactici]
MKILYFYDPDTKEKLDGQEKVVPDNFKITDEKSATLVAPEQGLWSPIKFDETNQKWIGTTEADYLAAHPAPAQTATDTQQQLAALSYQQMITQQTITDLQKQNAQMAYQLMTAQGGTKA